MLTDRELDLLVAQHVFGETIRQRTHEEMGVEGIIGNGFVRIECAQCGKKWRRLTDIDIFCSAPPDPPRYSTSGELMLAVIEKMQTKDWLVSVTLKLCGERVETEAMQFAVEFRQCVAPWGDAVAYDPSAPRAVAIAALRALGVTVDA